MDGVTLHHPLTKGNNMFNQMVKKFEIKKIETGQTEFILPEDSVHVVSMVINGIHNLDYIFNVDTHTVRYKETLYGIDNDDEVYFLYNC